MGNYNDHLMEQLADQGDGFYAYIDTFEQATELFVEDLTPTLTVVASDAKAQVVFDPAAVEAYRLVGYENRRLDDAQFRDDDVDAGELGAGHAVTALYEVRPRHGDVIGEVRLRATPPSPRVASRSRTRAGTPWPSWRTGCWAPTSSSR
jgi:Ca-activated chloride channel family protein